MTMGMISSIKAGRDDDIGNERTTTRFEEEDRCFGGKK